VELIDRGILGQALKVAASRHRDPERARQAAATAIGRYSADPARRSEWFGDDCPEGLTSDQARRMVFAFTADVIDGCTARTSPEHRRPCKLCVSGQAEIAGLLADIEDALEVPARLRPLWLSLRLG
jgi:hypothetical protein